MKKLFGIRSDGQEAWSYTITGGGLTDAGREYVRECQRLGILVDVSHISDEAFWDIMNITEKDLTVTMDFADEELGNVSKDPKITLSNAYPGVGAISVSSVIANLQAGENNAAAG